MLGKSFLLGVLGVGVCSSLANAITFEAKLSHPNKVQGSVETTRGEIAADAVLKAIYPEFDPKSRKTGGPDEGFNSTPRKKVVRDDGGEPVVLGLALKEVPWRSGLLLAIVKIGTLSEGVKPEKLSAEDEKSYNIFIALLGIQSPGSVALLDRKECPCVQMTLH
jgi:hypothetical protein